MHIISTSNEPIEKVYFTWEKMELAPIDSKIDEFLVLHILLEKKIAIYAQWLASGRLSIVPML